MSLRRVLVPLDDHDATMLRRCLGTVLEPLEHHLDAYIQIAKRRQMHQKVVTGVVQRQGHPTLFGSGRYSR